jgi:hypothetical protein
VGSTVEILPPPQRDANGRWLPGDRSPNAGGVSREKRELIDLARERSPAAASPALPRGLSFFDQMTDDEQKTMLAALEALKGD